MVFLKKYFWLNGSLWNQNWFFYSITVKNLLSTFIFKSENKSFFFFYLICVYTVYMYYVYIKTNIQYTF